MHRRSNVARAAGYVIHTPAGLCTADEQRAREPGPDHVTGAALPEDLTREAGFSHVTREDVNPGAARFATEHDARRGGSLHQ